MPSSLSSLRRGALIIRANYLQGSDDAQIQGSLRDWLAVKKASVNRAMLTKKGCSATFLSKFCVKESNQATVDGDVNPSLDQIRVCLTVAVLNYPLFKPVAFHLSSVKLSTSAPFAVIMPVKPHDSPI